jgi:hypothetical protein
VTGTPATLLVSRCGACHSRFLPRSGPCPRCGSVEVFPETLPAAGVVLAATELQAPAAGWTAPHRLVLIELAQSVRVLCLTEEELPKTEALVLVTRDGDIYRCAARSEASGRGEGDFHEAGRSRPSFEPPR